MCCQQFEFQHCDKTLSRWITPYFHPPTHRTQYLCWVNICPAYLYLFYSSKNQGQLQCALQYSVLASFINLNFSLPILSKKRIYSVKIMTKYINVYILPLKTITKLSGDGWGAEFSIICYRFIETSKSFRQSTMVLLCLCTALWSVCTVFNKDVKATYLDDIKLQKNRIKM